MRYDALRITKELNRDGSVKGWELAVDLMDGKPPRYDHFPSYVEDAKDLPSAVIAKLVLLEMADVDEVLAGIGTKESSTVFWVYLNRV